MTVINETIKLLSTIVTLLGAGVGIWGVVNLLEGYGGENPGAKSQGMKQLMANLEEHRTQRKAQSGCRRGVEPELQLPSWSQSSSFLSFFQNLNRDFFPRLFVGDWTSFDFFKRFKMVSLFVKLISS